MPNVVTCQYYEQLPVCLLVEEKNGYADVLSWGLPSEGPACNAILPLNPEELCDTQHHRPHPLQLRLCDFNIKSL